jgi:5-methylthioadenosine/S-adenosylhomocysteine deaminase
MRRSFVAFLFFLLALPALAAPKRVDLIVTGGTVLTMAGANIDDGAVAIDKGVIVGVGTSKDIVRDFVGKQVISAKGKAVLPGFDTAHTHGPLVLFRGIADDRDLMDWLQHFIFPAEA